MKKETVECITLVGQFENGGDLWLSTKDPETPQKMFDFIMDNVEKNETVEIKIEDIPKEDFDREW